MHHYCLDIHYAHNLKQLDPLLFGQRYKLSQLEPDA